MSTQRFLIAIPARRASTRLADKLLLRETGKTLLQHTIERAQEAARRLRSVQSCPEEHGVRVAVVCDDPLLADVAHESGVTAVLTGPAESGTERIARALDSLPSAAVVANLQADEPEMPCEWIVDSLLACRPEEEEVVTIAVPIESDEATLNNPNAVKVVLDHQGRALYFSRQPIPALRAGGVPPQPRALKHVGLYVYSNAFLKNYFDLPASPLEQSECLEQLRFLQGGVRIKVLVRTERTPMRGIDTHDDYRAFVDRHALMARETGTAAAAAH